MPFAGTGTLLLFLAKATLLLVAALVATATLKRSTAGARHLVWLTALVGVLALPLLSRIPSLRLGLLPSALATQTLTADAPVSAADAPQAVVVSTPDAHTDRRATTPTVVVTASTNQAAAVAGGVEDGV